MWKNLWVLPYIKVSYINLMEDEEDYQQLSLNNPYTSDIDYEELMEECYPFPSFQQIIKEIPKDISSYDGHKRFLQDLNVKVYSVNKEVSHDAWARIYRFICKSTAFEGLSFEETLLKLETISGKSIFKNKY